MGCGHPRHRGDIGGSGTFRPLGGNACIDRSHPVFCAGRPRHCHRMRRMGPSPSSGPAPVPIVITLGDDRHRVRHPGTVAAAAPIPMFRGGQRRWQGLSPDPDGETARGELPVESLGVGRVIDALRSLLRRPARAFPEGWEGRGPMTRSGPSSAPRHRILSQHPWRMGPDGGDRATARGCPVSQ